MTLQAILAGHAFTRGLGPDQLAELAAMACKVTFEEDQLILEDRGKSQWFYLVIAGSVTVELRTASYAVSVEAVGPGQAFGWSALLEDHDSLFGVRAREHTVALRFDGASLKALCHKDPTLGTELLSRVLQLVAGRVRATEVRFAEMCGVRA